MIFSVWDIFSPFLSHSNKEIDKPDFRQLRSVRAFYLIMLSDFQSEDYFYFVAV